MDRFEVVNQVIEGLQAGCSDRSLQELISKMGTSVIFEIWDATRNMLYDQDIIEINDNILTVNKRVSSNAANGTRLSAETKYITDIVSWASKLMPGQHEMLVKSYGEQKKTKWDNESKIITHVKKNLEILIQAQGRNDGSTNKSPTAVPRKNQNSNLEGNLQIKVILDQITNATDTITNQMNKVNDTLNDKIEESTKAVEKTLDTKINESARLITTRIDDISADLNNEINEIKNQAEITRNLVADLQKKIENLELQHEDTINNVIQANKNVTMGRNFSTGRIRRDSNDSALSNSSNQSYRRPFIWGGANDEDDTMIIDRAYVFAITKIPNQDKYSDIWLKKEQERIFNGSKINGADKIEIIQVERIKSNFNEARTKSFKMIVKVKGLSMIDMFNKSLWINGVCVKQYIRRREAGNVNYRDRNEQMQTQN